MNGSLKNYVERIILQVLCTNFPNHATCSHIMNYGCGIHKLVLSNTHCYTVICSSSWAVSKAMLLLQVCSHFRCSFLNVATLFCLFFAAEMHMKAAISFESAFCQQLRPGMLSIDTLKEVKESHPACSQCEYWFICQNFH